MGADIVEVAPAYDGAGEQTALVASQVGFEILTNWVGRGLAEMEKLDTEDEAAKGYASLKDEL